MAFIDGGAGNDRFILGNASEHIDGGAGTDTLINDSATGARISLRDTKGTGVATQDRYEEIENIVGSATGGDKLFGTDKGNQLTGRGGFDRLHGYGGDDELIGGPARDALAGGAGDDAFVFLSTAEAGDSIYDFGTGDDVIHISAAGFGAGLKAGQLPASAFYASSSGLAHDASDRFLFDTTDKTLWFDADGNGSGARVLIANLNDDARFGSADILIV